MAAMSVDDQRAIWERLGSDDPLWAVLSRPARKGGRWDVAEFFATGTSHARDLVRLAERHGYSLGERALDFGCGVGRLSRAVSEHVERVVGVDIASTMVERARQLNDRPERVEFVGYDGLRLPFGDDEFDSAVSLIVIQHIPPAAQLRVLLELNRVVRPGGVLVFQAPSGPRAVRPVGAESRRADVRILDAPAALRPGETARVRVRVRNDSPEPWPSGQRIKLGNRWFAGPALVVPDDARAELGNTLGPGASVELVVVVTAPEEPGDYRLGVDMLQESVAWWSEPGPAAETTVRVTPDAAEEPGGEPGSGDIEMHSLPERLVQAFFEHCGGRVIAAEPDELAGGDWDSRTYLIEAGPA